MKITINNTLGLALIAALLAIVGCSNPPPASIDTDGNPQTDGGASLQTPPPKRTPRPLNDIDTRFVDLRTHTAIIFHTQRIRSNEVYNNRLIQTIPAYEPWVTNLPTQYAILLSDAKSNTEAGFAESSLWVFKFDSNFEAFQWTQDNFENVQKKKISGKEYFTMEKDGVSLAAYSPDANTVLYGPPSSVAPMVTAPPTSTQLADHLQHVDADHDICFLFALTQQSSSFTQLAGEWFTSEEKALIESAAANCDWIEGGIDLGGNPLVIAEFEYADANIAAEQLPKMQEATSSAKARYKQQRAVIGAALEIGAAENIMQAIDRSVERLKVKQKGEIITVSAPAPSATATLARMLFVAGNDLRKAETTDSGE